MAGKIKELVPAGKGKETPPARREEEYPLFSLQRDVNRLFEDFFRGFDLRPLRMAEEKWGGFSPKMDLEETEKEYRITAELPGMEEKDVEVLLSGNSITLKGEKKEEKEERDKSYYHMERSYRVLPADGPAARGDRPEQGRRRFQERCPHRQAPQDGRGKNEKQKGSHQEREEVIKKPACFRSPAFSFPDTCRLLFILQV